MPSKKFVRCYYIFISAVNHVIKAVDIFKEFPPPLVSGIFQRVKPYFFLDISTLRMNSRQRKAYYKRRLKLIFPFLIDYIDIEDKRKKTEKERKRE